MTNTLNFRRAAAGLLAFSLVAAGCGSDAGDDAADTTDASEESSGAVLLASDAWARTSPAAAENGAAYMVLTSTEDVAVVGASVSDEIAATTEIHETVAADSDMDHSDEMDHSDHSDHSDDSDMGAMTMQEIPSLDVPAGEDVMLEPGGYHVMLLGLVEPLETGDTFDVTLTLDNGDELVVDVEVREDAP